MQENSTTKHSVATDTYRFTKFHTHLVKMSEISYALKLTILGCYVLGSKTLAINVLELQFVLCWQTMIKR